MLGRLFGRVFLGGLVIVSATAVRADDLPLEKVVLFNSGVGYLEHRGKVTDDAAVELKFNVENINDLLKSMVLEDQDGGEISTISYSSRDPISKTLKTFTVDLTEEPTLADLLRQVRGAEVRVEDITKNKTFEGKIISIEERTRAKSSEGETPAVVELLNLFTKSGVVTVPFGSIGEVRFIDAKLNRELGDALEILATAHASDKKTVMLKFKGKGERKVRVGYIQQVPLWRTSYRLVLDEKQPPFLQGWAMVENTSDHDWNDVKLSLVSGRPISFIMDLYQPLYVGRPLVQPELYGSLGPQKYGQNLEQGQIQAWARGNVDRYGNFGGGAMGGVGGGGSGGKGGVGRGSGVRRPVSTTATGGVAPQEQFAVGDTSVEPPEMMQEEQINTSPDDRFNPTRVKSVAQAADVGELFQYEIKELVNLPRQQSGMLPIVNAAIEGEKVSIYNRAVQEQHPLNGVQLKNTSDVHLMQGPITVFDGGEYAGDAQIADLPSGERRLISYALDLEVEVSPEKKIDGPRVLLMTLDHGVIRVQSDQQRKHIYRLKNSSKDAKKLLIEQPIDIAWQLKTPEKPAERSRDQYRFEIELKPGEAKAFEVIEVRKFDQAHAILGSKPDDVVAYLRLNDSSPQVKETLERLVAQWREAIALEQESVILQNREIAIQHEQQRIRDNMMPLERSSELYQRYVTTLGKQEDELAELRTAKQKQLEHAKAAMKAFEAAVRNTVVE